MDVKKLAFLVFDELNKFCSTLDDVGREEYKVKKSAVVYNIVSKYQLSAAEIETVCFILFEDKNETFEEIKTRIEK